MDQNTRALAEQIASIIMPHATGTRALAIKNRTRLVHYASAETALKIIKNREIWLRDSRCMNDFQEVLGGARQIEEYFNDPIKKAAFVDAFDKCHPGAAAQGIQQFMDWRAATWANTFLMSFSEHDPSEDRYGRLSMWRAYGREAAGVAIVMNIPMDQVSDQLNAFLSPVGYFDSIEGEMAKIIANVNGAQGFLKRVQRQMVVNSIYTTLTMAATCLKHPGFCEEREWRFIHLPKSFPSQFLRTEIETIDGVPQSVYKMKLADAGRAGIKGLEPAELVHKVIIGPTAFPYPIQDAFITALGSAGISKPHERLVVSNIPLRV